MPGPEKTSQEIGAEVLAPLGGDLDRFQEGLGLDALVVAVLEQVLQGEGLLGDQVGAALLGVARIDRSDFAAELDQIGLRALNLSFQAGLFPGQRSQNFGPPSD